MLNCFLQPLHFHTLRVERKLCSVPSQFGQVIPFGQRIGIRYAKQLLMLAKNLIASISVFGW